MCVDHISTFEQGIGRSCKYCERVRCLSPVFYFAASESDLASRMLYDFHQYQNEQRPNSVHATYIVCGIKAGKSLQKNGDVEMTSSMLDDEPPSEEITTTTITLTREEDLTSAERLSDLNCVRPTN